MYICKKKNNNNNKKNKQTTCSSNITFKKKIQANIYSLHFNKNFITLDLKIQAFEAERISYGRMFNLSAIP